MEFENLPRSLKEEIFSYLEDKEYYNLRKINKKWKEAVENPNSIILNKKIENCKQNCKIWKKEKKFYRGFKLTSAILATTMMEIRLECCYGKIYRETYNFNLPHFFFFFLD